MKALLFESLDDKNVRCNLCNHRCLIRNGKRGLCHVRENRNGTLETLVYGKLIARSVDPVEKKPLFHVAPGTLSYSIATVGCNFKCRFCQNSDIAQMPADRNGLIIGDDTDPGEIVKDALSAKCRSIAYTYTEPAVYFEYVLDTAKKASEAGILNVLVSNGYLTPEAITLSAPYIDAANIDLKSFSDDFYKTHCGARLERVKDTIKFMKQSGIFLEITTLIIPGLNDDIHELEALACFISEEVGPETPWHISRFHPSYRLTDRPVTPIETLSQTLTIGKQAGLKYVYTGNVPGDAGEKTDCFNCGTLLIDRRGYTIINNSIKNSACPKCNTLIDGVDI